MDCLLLVVWTLPAAILSGSSMQFPTFLWLGNAVKTLQLCCLCCMSHAASLTSDSISSSELNHDYVFVTPVKVDSSGLYISHNVLHSTRKKRSTHSSRSSLHYKFSAFGQELHLELKPSTILSNSFIVQVLGKDGVSNSQEHEIEQCFYQGFIRNDSTSSVAISTCVGLVSVSFKQISTQTIFILGTVVVLAKIFMYHTPFGNFFLIPLIAIAFNRRGIVIVNEVYHTFKEGVFKEKKQKTGRPSN